MAKHLEGKVAIVTGAGRGIGRGIALELARQGAKVVVNDLGATVEGQSSDETPAQEVVNQIRAEGGIAEANYADVADHQQAEDLVRQALTSYQGLDILINVAGILRERMIFNMTEEEWDAVIRVHLKGTYNTTHFASIHWRTERKGGYRLINFSSTAGINGSPGQPNYAAAKAGLIGFTKSCANALARYGVTANAIAPGAATRMTDRGLRNRDNMRQGIAESETVAGSERDPENVAPGVVFLCTDAASNISGRTVGISGYRITLYSDMVPEREIYGTQRWEVDDLVQRLPETVFHGLVPPSGDRPMGGGA